MFGLDPTELLQSYGYWALLIGTFLEGETIVIIAGFLAQQGILYPPYIALSAFVGSLTSDQLMFFLGRYKGIAIIQRFPRLNRNLSKATKLLARYETGLILGFRFIYGVRNVTPILMGLSGVSHVKFLVLNIIGAAIWAVAFTAAGYYSGHVFSSIFANFSTTEICLISGAVISVGAWLFWRRRKRKAELPDPDRCLDVQVNLDVLKKAPLQPPVTPAPPDSGADLNPATGQESGADGEPESSPEPPALHK